MTRIRVNRGQRPGGLLLRLFVGFFLAFNFAFFMPSAMAKRWDEIVRINAEVDQVISVHVSQDIIGFKVAPTSAGTFVYNSSSVSVSTNSKYGYKLYMATLNDSTSLIHDGKNTSDKIESITEETSVMRNQYDNFAMNSWGYSLRNYLDDDNSEVATVFNPIPNEDYQISSSDEPVNNAQTPITIGAKVNNELESGSYQNTLLFTAITEFFWDEYIVPEFYEIVAMQEMTTAICDSAITPQPGVDRVDALGVYYHDDTWVPETRLVDRRDGHIYRVRKLADGHCWMVEDLSLDMFHNMELTNAETDLETRPKWLVDRVAIDNFRKTADTDVVGYFYNWYAATTEEHPKATNEDEDDSICPRGWRLPHTAGDKSYDELFKLYPIAGEATMMTPWDEPIILNRAGSYESSEDGNDLSGYFGSYWTAGASEYEESGNAIFFGWLNPVTMATPKHTSLPIRCVNSDKH